MMFLFYQLVTNKSHPRVGLAELRSNMRAPDRMIIASNLPLWPFVGHYLILFNLQSGLNSVQIIGDGKSLGRKVRKVFGEKADFTSKRYRTLYSKVSDLNVRFYIFIHHQKVLYLSLPFYSAESTIISPSKVIENLFS